MNAGTNADSYVVDLLERIAQLLEEIRGSLARVEERQQETIEVLRDLNQSQWP